MVAANEKELINYRYALAFKKLIEDNKKKALRQKKKGEDFQLDDSYGKISSSTGLRPATISNLISGLSDIKASTIALLLESLGRTYSQFGKIMDGLTEHEVMAYKVHKEKERGRRK
jgi:hypothetical protein